MCLPAAHETVHTWIQGFGLSRMPLDDLDSACKELRLLIFPGTQVLQKQLLPPLPPTPAPQPDLKQSGQDAALDTNAQLLNSLPTTSALPADLVQDAQPHTAVLPDVLAAEALPSTAPKQPFALAIQQPSQVTQLHTAADLTQNAQPHTAALPHALAADALSSTAPQPFAIAIQQPSQIAQADTAAERKQAAKPHTAAPSDAVTAEAPHSTAQQQPSVTASQQPSQAASPAALGAHLDGFAAEQANVVMATGSDAAAPGSDAEIPAPLDNMAFEGTSLQARPATTSPRVSPASTPQALVQVRTLARIRLDLSSH